MVLYNIIYDIIYFHEVDTRDDERQSGTKTVVEQLDKYIFKSINFSRNLTKHLLHQLLLATNNLVIIN